MRADEDNFYMEVDLSAPSIVIRGDFKGEGQYNALKVKAYGDFNTSMCTYLNKNLMFMIYS